MSRQEVVYKAYAYDRTSPEYDFIPSSCPFCFEGLAARINVACPFTVTYQLPLSLLTTLVHRNPFPLQPLVPLHTATSLMGASGGGFVNATDAGTAAVTALFTQYVDRARFLGYVCHHDVMSSTMHACTGALCCLN